ncbi:hypothetical protein [Bacillus sp. M6-12]|uniref:hypothetical protein n=1 Tax=Bacillus sp. M6-12 TaxID=2054166 RepID=UPI001158CB30|nr:hypothetical protein [Bacillus sp. M6-12]
MRTEQDLKVEFGGEEHSYEKKEQVDLTYVIQHLLNEKFVVLIEKGEYLVSFGLGDNGIIAYSWSGQPHLTSYAIIEKAFSKGIWFTIKETKRTKK